ncbi:25171_t:CDS:1, partial [Racocetra persica]
ISLQQPPTSTLELSAWSLSFHFFLYVRAWDKAIWFDSLQM